MKFNTYASALDGKYRLDLTETGEMLIGKYPRDVQNVHFSLGLTCNFRCGHCPVSNSRAKIVRKYEAKSSELGVDLGDPTVWTDPELVKASLGIFPNVEQIGLGCGGGEPTLHPRYEEIINISTDFFAAKAPKGEEIRPDQRLFWWTKPYEYGLSQKRVVDVHKGGRVVLLTNATGLPQERTTLKDYLLRHPGVTFEVSYDGFHEANYRRLGLDFGRMIATLNELAGDTQVQNAGVQVYLFHVGNESIVEIERAFPHCLVNTSNVVEVSPDRPPVMERISRGPHERHAILDSQGNVFHTMNDVYSANLDYLCGKVRKVET
jgi:hypothetical protein